MTADRAAERPSRSRSGSATAAHSILLVEDDPAERDALSATLAAHGYRVECAATGAEALQRTIVASPDLVLLDLGLPDVDGIDLCRHLKLRVTCPVIVVSGDDQVERVVAALDTGADDYVVKPFAPSVLLARIRVALRHGVVTAQLAHEQMLHCGDVTVDVAARVVIIDGTEVDGFTRRQFDLLVAFMRNEGRLLTYATLIGVVWGVEVDGDHHWPSLRTAISRVRRTLGDGADRPIVLTEKHVGYRLVLPGQG